MKAIVLLSGGLDSSLALKLIADQGVDVLALHFSSPFCRCDGTKGCGFSARKISESIGVRLRSIYLGEEYLEIVKNPRHGRGKNMNPCIDCRILKFARAKEVMDEEGASFIVTGEVLGQRPMSQHRNAMNLIVKKSGLKGLIVRPLCAKLFPPTIPEEKGWIKRDLLLDFQGRTRKPQMRLAKDLGINDYPCPAGGCLLTLPSFAVRVKDLLDHGSFDMNSVELLKLGRHLRLTPEFKLIIGRDESENNKLTALKQPEDIIFEPVNTAGPTGIGRGPHNEEIIQLSSRIMARYMDPTESGEGIKIRIGKEGRSFVIPVEKAEEKLLEKWRI